MPESQPSQMTPAKRRLSWGIGAALLVLGAVAAMVLVRMREPPRTDDAPHLGPLVETIRLQTQDVTVVVEGHGTVRAKTRAQLVPQVAGRIEYVAPELTAGGFFRAGQTLIRLDAADYELALSQAQARLAEAQAAIAVAEAQIQERQAALDNAAVDASRIRELFDANAANRREFDRALAVEKQAAALVTSAEAQLVSARASRQAAEVAVQVAQTDLGRVTIAMPFDGRVLSENVDPGQYVSRGNVLAEVYGLEAVEVVVPLEDARLRWLDIPLTPNAAANRDWTDYPRAAVSASFAGRPVAWEGRAVRVEGELDPLSRVVRVVVEVPEPYDQEQELPPLMPGTFVDVDIQGQVIEGAVAVPRHAVHQGDVVWVVEDSRLRRMPVTIVRSDRNTAYVTEGLPVTAEVIVSQLDTVTEGMQVRTGSGSGAGSGRATAAPGVNETAADTQAADAGQGDAGPDDAEAELATPAQPAGRANVAQRRPAATGGTP